MNKIKAYLMNQIRKGRYRKRVDKSRCDGEQAKLPITRSLPHQIRTQQDEELHGGAWKKVRLQLRNTHQRYAVFAR